MRRWTRDNARRQSHAHIDVDHPERNTRSRPGRTHTVIIYNERSFFFTHTHTHTHTQTTSWCLDKTGSTTSRSGLLTADANLRAIKTQGSLGSAVTTETRSIRDRFQPYWLKQKMHWWQLQITFFQNRELQFDIVSLLPSEGVTAMEETTPQAKWRSMKNQFV